MDSGQIEYTVSNKTVRLAPGPSFRAFLRLAHPWVLAQLVLLGAAAASGHAWLYLLWVASYLTTFSVFVRIRSMAEHACTEQDLDVFRSTRTTWANPLARVTVAPHRVNFHLEHHLLMTAPYFRLPLLHRLLAQRGALAKAHVSPGYLDVIRRTTARTKAGA